MAFLVTSLISCHIQALTCLISGFFPTFSISFKAKHKAPHQFSGTRLSTQGSLLIHWTILPGPRSGEIVMFAAGTGVLGSGRPMQYHGLETDPSLLLLLIVFWAKVFTEQSFLHRLFQNLSKVVSNYL